MPKTMSLLEKAKSMPRSDNRRHGVTQEEMELAIGWAKNEIGMQQVANITELKHSSNVYTFLAITLRAAFKSGLITDNKGKQK